jgi:hypothetical protein
MFLPTQSTCEVVLHRLANNMGCATARSDLTPEKNAPMNDVNVGSTSIYARITSGYLRPALDGHGAADGDGG